MQLVLTDPPAFPDSFLNPNDDGVGYTLERLTAFLDVSRERVVEQERVGVPLVAGGFLMLLYNTDQPIDNRARLRAAAQVEQYVRVDDSVDVSVVGVRKKEARRPAPRHVANQRTPVSGVKSKPGTQNEPCIKQAAAVAIEKQQRSFVRKLNAVALQQVGH